MPKIKLRKGDLVVMLSGKDKGKKGNILAVFPSKNKVVVEGLNMSIVSCKYRGEHLPYGLIPRPSLVDISKVSLIDPKLGLKTKIGFKFDKDGKKVRYCRKSGEIIG